MAPEPLSTVVSPREISPQEMGKAVATLHPAPARTFNHYALTYPEGFEANSTSAVNQVVGMYADCARCHLCDRRTRIAHIKGNPEAAIVAVGEGPGKDEDVRGVTFCGKSGRLQDEFFREAGIDPLNDIAWINLVGCRPCNTRFEADRAPTLVEKVACSERFLSMLRALRPRVILCLGAQATDMIWAKAPLQNTWHTLRAPDGEWVVVGVMRHPAYLARTIGIARPGPYAEYFGAKMMLEELRERMNGGLTKVSRWPFGLRYLENLQTAAGK